MRTIQLHPTSLFAGAALAVLAFVAMGQKAVPTGTPTGVLTPLGEYGDELQRQPKFAVHPRDWVQLEEGVPYLVPAGRIFVPLALGSILQGSSAQQETTIIRADGVDLAWAVITPVFQSQNGMASLGNGANMKPVPHGLAVAAGSAVEVIGGVRSSTPDDARAWGYLVDA